MYETRYSQVNAATRGTRISFLLLLFSNLVLHTSAKSQISCFSQEPPRQRLGDCDAALNMIPNGVQDLGVDLEHLYPSDSKKPISLQFEHPGRNRTYLIPAAFRFGTCVILVGSLGWNPHPPVKAVSAMYFKVWPNVRKAAGTILKTCPQRTPKHWSWFGWVVAWTWPNQWQFHCFVEVRWAPEVATRDGERRRMDASEVLYTIYQTD